MSEQSSSNPPATPTLCKMDCGFFGSDATGNFCSKCWMESMKQQAASAPSTAMSGLQAMEVCPKTTSSVTVDFKGPKDAGTVPPSAKSASMKKKKVSYKSLMSNMLNNSHSPLDKLEKEQNAQQQGLGGGQFRKIEKI